MDYDYILVMDQVGVVVVAVVVVVLIGGGGEVRGKEEKE